MIGEIDTKDEQTTYDGRRWWQKDIRQKNAKAWLTRQRDEGGSLSLELIRECEHFEGQFANTNGGAEESSNPLTFSQVDEEVEVHQQLEKISRIL